MGEGLCMHVNLGSGVHVYAFFLNWQYIMIFFFEENNKVVENGK